MPSSSSFSEVHRVWGRSTSRRSAVVEIDGIQHAWADHLVGDALRHNAVALSGLTVLRLPLLGLQVAPDDFFEQIEAALRAAGWTPDAG